MWDNRCLLHREIPYDMNKYRRVFRRTTVAGLGAIKGSFLDPTKLQKVEMLKLYSTDWSPWVRKVRIAAIERGLEDQIELVPANIGFSEKTLKTVESDLVKYNPSGRVPTLITEDGNYIFDSTVIVHYLDEIDKVHTYI